MPVLKENESTILTRIAIKAKESEGLLTTLKLDTLSRDKLKRALSTIHQVSNFIKETDKANQNIGNLLNDLKTAVDALGKQDVGKLKIKEISELHNKLAKANLQARVTQAGIAKGAVSKANLPSKGLHKPEIHRMPQAKTREQVVKPMAAGYLESQKKQSKPQNLTSGKKPPPPPPRKKMQ